MTRDPCEETPADWPLIELGHGRIEVAEGHHEGVPALIFGRNGTGVIGDPTQPDRTHEPGETLAVVTFANVESLEVVAAKLDLLRRKLGWTGVRRYCDDECLFTCREGCKARRIEGAGNAG